MIAQSRQIDTICQVMICGRGAGNINLLTAIATPIIAEMSPADLRLIILQAESLTLAAQLLNCWISSAWPLCTTL